jgi:hypothetical protein
VALNFKTGEFQSPSDTQLVQVTGLGFQPKLVLFFAPYYGDEVDYAGQSYMFGMANGVANRCVGFDENGTGVAGNTNRAVTWQNNTNCIYYVGNATTPLLQLSGNLESFDIDGFTINFTLSNTLLWAVLI